MVTSKELEAVRRALRGKVREASGDVSVGAAELRTLLDEVGRLQQSNDRLRRQNRRARIKLQRAGLADAADAADAALDDRAIGVEPDEAEGAR